MKPNLKELIAQFDELYKEKSPLRYEKLQRGYNFVNIDKQKKLLHVDFLPDDYIELYTWRNGVEGCIEGWVNEFEDDSWYEILPLDDSNRFVSINDAVSLIEMWEKIREDKNAKNENCYWKNGFVPLLEDQNFGLTVLDTIGYFGGNKGQLIYFDYKCRNGYSIIYESITKWMQTCVELLKHDIVFYKTTTHKEFVLKDKIYKKINGTYIKKFNAQILLDDAN